MASAGFDPATASLLTDVFLVLMVIYLWATGQGIRWLFALVAATLTAVVLATVVGWLDVLPWLGSLVVASLVALSGGWMLEILLPRKHQGVAEAKTPVNPKPPVTLKG